MPGTATRAIPPGRVQKLPHSSRPPPYPEARARGREAARVGPCRRVRRRGARDRRGSVAGAAREARPARFAPLVHRRPRGGRRPRRARHGLRPGTGEPGARAAGDRSRASRPRPRAGAARRDRCARGGRALPRRVREAGDERPGRVRTARPAHRPAPPQRVPRAARGRGRALAPVSRQPRARPLRPRPLQGDQRPRRPPRGRPPAARVRLAPSLRRSGRRTLRADSAATSSPRFSSGRLPRTWTRSSRGSGRCCRTASPSAPARPTSRTSAPSSSGSSKRPTAASTRTRPPGPPRPAAFHSRVPSGHVRGLSPGHGLRGRGQLAAETRCPARGAEHRPPRTRPGPVPGHGCRGHPAVHGSLWGTPRRASAGPNLQRPPIEPCPARPPGRAAAGTRHRPPRR